MRRISIPMCVQRTTCNPHWSCGPVRLYLCSTAQVEHHEDCASDYTVLPQIDDEQCHTQAHLQLENWHHLQHGSVYLKSSDSFSTVPPIVNGGSWGCMVRDLKTIIDLTLLAFNFIRHGPHHSQTPMRSRIREGLCYCNSLILGMPQQTSKWSYRHTQSAYFPE